MVLSNTVVSLLVLLPTQVGESNADTRAQASSVEPATVMLSVPELIAELGSASYERRERAMRLLSDFGPSAFDDVLEATSSERLEVSRRASRVLRDGFLRGWFPQPSENEQSWQRLKELLEDAPRTRRLFLEMQTAAPDLLTLAETNPERCPAYVAEFLKLDFRAHPFAAGALKAAIFAVCCDDRDPDVKTSVQVAVYLHTKERLLSRTDTDVRRLLGPWVARVSRRADAGKRYAFFRVVNYFQLGECSNLVRRVAVTKRGGGNTYQAQAMYFLSKFGGPEDVALLEKGIGDNASLGVIRGKDGSDRQCKLGDVALAACILLTGQDLTQYDLEVASADAVGLNEYRQYGFRTEEARQAAREKWSRWREGVE